MNKIILVALALWRSQSLAIKVSVSYSACENHLRDEVISLTAPDGCLIVDYPETDNKDVALLFQGVSKNGVREWKSKIGRSLGNDLEIKSDRDTFHLTVKNVVNGKKQKVKDLKSGQVFDLDDDVIAEDSKSMTLEEFRRIHDVFSKENQEGAQLESRQVKCADVWYYNEAICKGFIKQNGCTGIINELCKKTCGNCPKPAPTTAKATTTKANKPAPTTAKATTTKANKPAYVTTHKMMMTTPPTCTQLPPLTTICTTPKFNMGPAPGPVMG